MEFNFSLSPALVCELDLVTCCQRIQRGGNDNFRVEKKSGRHRLQRAVEFHITNAEHGDVMHPPSLGHPPPQYNVMKRVIPVIPI